MVAPERSYVFSAGPLDAPLEHPPWMGGTHPEDLDELPHEAPTLVDRALVDYTVHLLPDETCPYCMELRDTSECCGVVPVMNEQPPRLRKPIPVKENWRG